MTTEFPGEVGAVLEDPYAMWDAAYVLGSLSSAERREFENHLSGCKSCRTAVAELSGMPALLALVDREDMARAEDEAAIEPPPLRPEVLAWLLAKVSWRRRRQRWITGTVVAAAAAVLAVGVLVAARPMSPLPEQSPPGVTATALTMTPVLPSEFDVTLSLTSHGWGTHIEMACTYREESHDAADGDETDAGDKLAMVAVGRDGSRTQLATWMSLPSSTSYPTGSTSLPIDQIAAIQVVSADSGDLLMQRIL